MLTDRHGNPLIGGRYHRIGRVQRQCRRALIAHGTATIRDLLSWCLSEIAQLQPVAAQIRAARNQEIRVAGATTKAAICRTLDAEMMAHRMGKPVPMTAKHSVAQPIIETIKRLDPNFGPKWSRNKKRGRRPGEGTAAPDDLTAAIRGGWGVTAIYEFNLGAETMFQGAQPGGH